MLIEQVTALDKGRKKLLLDNGITFILYKKDAKDLTLEEGEEITEGQYLKIRNEILVIRAKKRAMHLLEQMDRTEFQLRNKLKQNDYEEDIIEEAITYVARYNYIDDLRYARNYVRSKRDEKSPLLIKTGLMQKGVLKEIINQALEEEYPINQEQKLIGKWVEKKHYKADIADWKEKQRLYQFLLRKGFSHDDILYALDHLT
ncbi:regulatory protein RecX [Lachnospiraceae bacterium ZAX-1]